MTLKSCENTETQKKDLSVVAPSFLQVESCGSFFVLSLEAGKYLGIEREVRYIHTSQGLLSHPFSPGSSLSFFSPLAFCAPQPVFTHLQASQSLEGVSKPISQPTYNPFQQTSSTMEFSFCAREI